jgi:hypothetical protein
MEKFWPLLKNAKRRKKLSPNLVWTEIFSVIKGSAQTYTGFMSGGVYQKHGSFFLSKMEKTTVYFYYLQYEKWKKE